MNLHTYAVILKNYEDLEDFYIDMETEGGDFHIPNRSIEVAKRKPTSRVTYYLLTKQEAEEISNDSRVENVELYRPDLFPELHAIYSRDAAQNATHTNWGLEIHKPLKFVNSLLPYTGKNVDVIILDDDGWQPDHPEFQDANGVSRVVEYNWFQHAEEVGDTDHIGDVYTYGTDTNGGYHNIHVAGTLAGKTQGWAKDANIYFLGLTFSGNSSEFNVPDSFAFDYIRAFHRNKPVNPITGRKNPTIVNNSWGYTGYFNQRNLIDPKNVYEMSYQGQTILPAIPRIETWDGYYAVCDSNQIIVEANGETTTLRNNTIKFTTTDATTATVEEITYTPISSPLSPATSGFTEISSMPFTLPFSVNYLGTTYTSIGIVGSSVITFGSFSSGTGTPSSPALPKLLIASNTKDSTVSISYRTRDVSNNGGSVWFKENGISPNRTFTVMYRGFKDFNQRNLSDFLGADPTLIWQAVFYENEPNRIDVTIDSNPMSIVSGGFTIEEIQSLGCNGVTYPVRNLATDADAADAMNDNIIMTSSAGNSSMAQYRPNNINYNNSLIGIGGTVSYNKLSTPSSAGENTPNSCIVVGSLDNSFLLGFPEVENKADYSNFGNGVDIWAAGSWIQSAWPNAGITNLGIYGSPVTASNGYKYAKISGTSMASPQVTGILACMLEKYPDMTQAQARELASTMSIRGELYDLPLGTWNYNYGLEGAANNMSYYKDTREENKPTYPKIHKGRPTIGAVYPRRQIRKRKAV